MTPHCLRWLTALFCVCLWTGSAPRAALAAAPHRDEGKDLADEAAERFKTGLFVEAAELFERAFSLNPDKIVRLRNAGRAWEEAGRLDQARHLFRRYIELMPEGPDRAEVRGRLARIEAKLAPPPAPVAPPTVAAAPAPAAPPLDPAPAMAVTARAAQASPSRPAAWLLSGAGVVACGLGVGWLVHTATVRSSYEDAIADGRYAYGSAGAAKKQADAKTLDANTAGAWAATGVGAAAAIGGLAWALWPAAHSDVVVAPWATPSDVGVSAAMRF